MFTCVLGRNVASSLISTQTFRRALTASVDSCAEIECPFSGVTNSGVSRKVSAGKRCSECRLWVVECLAYVCSHPYSIFIFLLSQPKTDKSFSFSPHFHLFHRLTVKRLFVDCVFVFGSFSF